MSLGLKLSHHQYFTSCLSLEKVEEMGMWRQQEARVHIFDQRVAVVVWPLPYTDGWVKNIYFIDIVIFNLVLD